MEIHWAIFTAITIGIGVQWHRTYDTVDQISRMMVGRSSHGGSIGAAGWLKEGGTAHCRLLMVLVWLSLLCLLCAYMSSGVDNAIEITVVTSCGEYLTTNNCRNSDLFWSWILVDRCRKTDISGCGCTEGHH